MYRQRSLVDHYRNASSAANAAETDPYRIVALLLAGALERSRAARLALSQGDIPEKIAQLRKTLGIVDGLRACLDHEAGGDIAGNLEALYEYIGSCLIDANAGNRLDKLDEAIALLGEIESAWSAIRPRQEPAPATAASHVATYG